MNTNEIIEFYLDNDVLISPEFIKELSDPENIAMPIKTSFIVLNKDVVNILNNNKQVVVDDFEKAIVLKEKRKDTKLYDKFIEYLAGENSQKNISQIPSIQKGSITEKKETKIETSVQAKPEDAVGIIDDRRDESVDDPLIIENKEEILVAENSVSNLEDPMADSLYQSPDSIVQELTDDEKKAISREEKNKSDAIEKIQRDKFLAENRIKIVSTYTTKSKKWSVADFVSFHTVRFKDIEKILRSRQELQSLTSIARIAAKKERENVALIGVVYEKSLTKAGNIMFTLEDQTGMIKVVVNKTKDAMFKLAEEIQLDETIGVTGTFDQILFANSILIPDIPLTKELKKSPEPGYAVIISDTQFGGKLFLEKEFEKFIAWIKGEMGNERQREIASMVKYIFIGGDLVEGVGIYPGQEYDLSIIDVKEQYAQFAALLKKIPSNIPIIICPGNHDVGRISEPQLPLSKEYAWPVLALPNVISLSNPSMVNIYAQPENNFDGLDVMFYHGYSFVYYSEKIPTIRQSGGQKRPDLIMKYLLQRRHLAPSHTSALYVPDPKKDPLFIERIPDILISGHIHRASVSSYKNVTCFNASCWVSKSPEQERRGLEPQPGRAFIVDMHTREVKVMNFLSREDQEKEGNSVIDN
ncbi:MAG TPA: metallophosphoesterase [Alphaproteobacteria bacterium]|nr:metallophosphoesterase [Alphaproteobacteria bacterium]